MDDPNIPKRGVMNIVNGSLEWAIYSYSPEDPDSETLISMGAQAAESKTADGDLDEAVQRLRRAYRAKSQHDSDWAICCRELATILWQLYEERKQITDLNEAIQIAKMTLKEGSLELAEQIRLSTLAKTMLKTRFRLEDSSEDLTELIDLGSWLVKNLPANSPGRATHFSDHSSWLGDRFWRTANMQDLQESIDFGSKAVEYARPDDRHMGTFKDHLSVRFIDRYLRTGAAADLDQAIKLSREALSDTSENDPAWNSISSNIGIWLSERYMSQGAIADLDEAIERTRRALSADSQHDEDWKDGFNNLSVLLSRRYDRVNDIADLNEAIELARRATLGTPPSHKRWAAYNGTLATSLCDRAMINDSADDVNEAVDLGYRILHGTRMDDPSAYRCLMRLAASMHLTYVGEKPTDPKRLDEAIRMAEHAMVLIPQDHPERSTIALKLAEWLGQRYSNSPVDTSIGDLSRAKELYASVLANEAYPTNRRIDAGRNYLRLPGVLRDDVSKTYEVAGITAKLIPLLAPQSLQQADKHHLMTRVVGTASDAAAVAIHFNDGGEAVRFLESGRGIMASGIRDMRTDLSTLAEQHRDLAERFIQQRDLLDSSFRTDDSLLKGGGNHEQPTTDQRHDAAKTLRDIVSEIRSLPQFKTFLQPPSDHDIRQTASLGTVVIVNVSSIRCDAVIITPTAITIQQLPGLTMEGVKERICQVQSRDTLEWLWDEISKPVLHHLGIEVPTGTLPRIWWIPTGPLVKFPLHAAGYHLRAGFHTTLDRVVSSYSWSTREIRHAMLRGEQKVGTQPSDPKMVLISMAETPSQTRLHFTTAEKNEILRAVQETEGLQCSQPHPFRDEVLLSLKSCSIFHFAGHGSAHPTDPLQSTLLLNDWQTAPLTVSSMLERNLASESPYLAYLSACGTSELRDNSSVDEAVHLAGAFLLAGFQNVVSTLWDVDDRESGLMAKATYAAILRPKPLLETNVAYALNEAMRKLRDEWASNRGDIYRDVLSRNPDLSSRRQRDETLKWTPYVHYGE